MDTLLLAQHDDDLLSDDSSSLNHHRPTGAMARDSVKLLLKQVTEVTINLRSNSKHEMLELRRKLQAELDLVRNLVNKMEGAEKKKKTKKPNGSAVAATAPSGVDNPRAKKNQQRAHLPQLSVSVMDDNGSQHMGDAVEKEKEKRTPKANKFYRNSDFLLAKDRFPPSDSCKKGKPHGKKQGGNESGHSTGGFSNKALKNCSALLERLMKHKHGWVFNTPVDPVALGLRDYLEIIKHPMDLGTVKSRLDNNWYKYPKEFAEDVRLTFNNAMTYNPKGQDVHVMAEQLLKMFEEKWVGIESEYMQEMRMAVSTYEAGLSTPTSRKGGGPLLSPSMETKRTLDRSDLTKNTADSIRKSMGLGRTPVPKKPKAREPNKRDMTYEEKQKLSSSLQNLPSDKLDDVVKIIKKRNSTLFQSDDEIEVDIDSFDTETLWELDRFVTNYKKTLSKNKRKAEVAIQARPEPEGSDDLAIDQTKSSSPVAVKEPKETKSDENNVSTRSLVQAEQQGDNGNRSCSTSSSRGDGSGSSSSDSESESSSGEGSDAGQSPKKQV